MYSALRASHRLFKSAHADLVPIEALGNDGSFIFMCFFDIGLKDKAKACAKGHFFY
jgi:hypothetical protein